MKIRSWYAMFLCGVFCTMGYGQSVRSLVNGGNDLYDKEKYTDAEINYRKALEKQQGGIEGHFNLGNALYKQGKYDESVREYENALSKAQEKETKAKVYFNIGNSHLKAQKYQDAITSYVESLKLSPDDQEAKYNLSYALAKLKEQQQQDKNGKNQEKNNEKQQDKKGQNKQDQQKQDQQKQDQQKQDQQQNQSQQQQQKAQQEKQMSKTDANRILEVLKNNEKDVQKKLRIRQGVRAKTDRDW